MKVKEIITDLVNALCWYKNPENIEVVVHLVRRDRFNAVTEIKEVPISYTASSTDPSVIICIEETHLDVEPWRPLQ